jgi:GGDEF domain-containing protein
MGLDRRTLRRLSRPHAVTSPVAAIQQPVAEHPRPHAVPRARPIAELHESALHQRDDELARRWAIALILARPLDDIGEVPLEDLARQAPSLCAHALRAIQSDVELERLTGRDGGAREHAAVAPQLAELTGAHSAGALVNAVEALRGVLWEALLDQLSQPSARLLADLSDRLAHVCSAMLAAALGDTPRSLAPETAHAVQAAGTGDAPGVGDAGGVPAGGARQQHGPRERSAALAHSASRSAREAVIVDERVPAPHVAERARAFGAEESAHAAPAPSPHRRSPSWEHAPPIAPSAPPAEIEIRDQRREEGPAAWIGSIGAQLQSFERDGLPFAVLLVELLDLERLQRQESLEGLSRLALQLERALLDALAGCSRSLTRERPGRCWLLAPATDRAAADELAQRLSAVAASRTGHHGAPLAVVIGAAVCPDDGRQAAALAAHADLGLYAARSASRR